MSSRNAPLSSGLQPLGSESADGCAASSTRASDSPLRALVVEDEPSWREILTELLTDMGLVVDLASNVESAVLHLRAKPHRLAVVDLSLGRQDHHNQDGLRVLNAVRRHDPGCKAILLTGYATVELAVSALTEYGAMTCLRKETFLRSQFRDVALRALETAPASLARAPDELRVRKLHSQSRHPSERDQPASSSKHEPRTEPLGRAGSGRQLAAATEVAGEMDPLSSVSAQEAHQQRGSALVVEDDAGWRDILLELLQEAGYLVHGCASYGEALGHLKRPDSSYQLAVVDLSLASSLMPENSDGYRLLAAAAGAGIPSLVVSGSASAEDVERAFDQYGVLAFLEKQAFDRRAFRRAVEDAQQAVQHLPDSTELDVLTAREREVLELLAEGLTNKAIGQRLVISENTVKRHLKSIFAKLDVGTRAAAAARAASVRSSSPALTVLVRRKVQE